MTRLCLLLLLSSACSELGTLWLTIDADPHVRAPAQVFRATARDRSGLMLVERELRREARELMWPIELPIDGESGRVEVSIEIEPHSATDGSTVSVVLRSQIQAARVRELDVDISTSTTIELGIELQRPYVPEPRGDDSECSSPPALFSSWVSFVNLDRGRTCAAFVDRIGCDLELVEDCTIDGERPSWRGGIRDDRTFFLTTPDAAIGCEGELDADDPLRARFACLPAHLGLRFSALATAIPFVSEVDVLDVDDGSAFAIDSDPRYQRAYIRSDRGIALLDPSLRRVGYAVASRVTELLDGGDALFTVEDGLIHRRDPVTLEIEATDPRQDSGFWRLHESALLNPGTVVLFAVKGEEISVLDRESLSVVRTRRISAEPIEFLSESDHVRPLLFFLSRTPSPRILIFSPEVEGSFVDSFALGFDPTHAIGFDHRAGFIAACPGRTAVYCYLEVDLYRRDIVGAAPLAAAPRPDSVGYNGLTLLDDEQLAIYGTFGVHTIDRSDFEPRLERRLDRPLDDLAVVGAELLGITPESDVERVVILQ
jgi:hypothetical protein